MIRALVLSLFALAFAASPALAIDNDVDIQTESPATYMYYSDNDTVINVFVTVYYASNHVVGKTLVLHYKDELTDEWSPLQDGSGEPANYLLLTNVTNGSANAQIRITDTDFMFDYLANGGLFEVRAQIKSGSTVLVSEAAAFNNLP